MLLWLSILHLRLWGYLSTVILSKKFVIVSKYFSCRIKIPVTDFYTKLTLIYNSNTPFFNISILQRSYQVCHIFPCVICRTRTDNAVLQVLNFTVRIDVFWNFSLKIYQKYIYIARLMGLTSLHTTSITYWSK